MKKCNCCKKVLPLFMFGIHTREKDGLQHICKKCEKEYRKNQYLRNRRKILDRNKRLLDKIPWRKTLNHIKERCNCKTNPKYYRYGGRGIKCLITEEELKVLWFRDKAYLMKQPSIDRIDNDGDYVFENCRYLELSENSIEMNLRLNTKSVYQINLNDKIVNEFISISEATRQTGINNISKVVRGLCQTAGNFKWRYK